MYKLFPLGKKILLALIALAVIVSIPAISNFVLTKVMAATLTSSKLTLSDSRAGQTTTTHTFQFTTATTGTIKKVEFQYCTTSTGSCVAPTGLVIGTATGAVTGVGAGTGSVASNVATYTITSAVSIASGTQVTIPWTNVTNPTTADTSFFINVRTLDSGDVEIDSAQVAAAVLTSTSITVTASIGPTFVFTVDPVDYTSDTSGIGLQSGEVNVQPLNVTTTANTIPFGALSSAVEKTAAHDITVETNSQNGYVVTVKYIDGGTGAPLADGTNNIDNFTGTNATPTTWSAPAGGTANTNTGFFGYTTEDSTLGTGTAGRFTSGGGNKWAGFDTTAYEVIYNATAPAGGTQSTRVGWQVEINSLQPAGDYTGTVILVATPTY